jgi:hypothetical protein
MGQYLMKSSKQIHFARVKIQRGGVNVSPSLIIPTMLETPSIRAISHMFTPGPRCCRSSKLDIS